MRKFAGKIAAAALLAAGMSHASFQPSPAAAASDVVIAMAGPLTGQYAAFGDQMRRGAEAAVADLNAKGGIKGAKIVLEVGDDACDPKQAVAAANQLVGKGVKFVAGHFCSSSSIPASAVYNEGGVIQITPASTNPALTEEAAAKGWTNVFRTCGRDDVQGVTAGAYIAKNFKGKNVAVLDDKSAYGKGLADETRKELAKQGVKVALQESYAQGDKDFSALVAKMKDAKIDVIYVGGYHTEAGLIIRQAREAGLDAALISGDALVTNEYWQITGAAGEGTRMTFSPDPRKKPEAQDIVARFKAAGYDPEGYTLYSYAAVQVYAQAVEKVGTDPAKVAAYLRANTFKTVLGDIEFDAKGDVKKQDYVMYVWKDGKYAEE